MDIIKTIKNAIDSGKITIGTDTTLKYMKVDKLDSAIIAANCPKNIRQNIENTAKLSKSKIHTFNGTSIELGACARKPFSITVLGLKK